jgi:hypothetical protein
LHEKKQIQIGKMAVPDFAVPDFAPGVLLGRKLPAELHKSKDETTIVIRGKWSTSSNTAGRGQQSHQRV